jgi:alpha-galactosidase
LHFRGLDADQLYRVNIIWPLQPSSSSASILEIINGSVISGDALKNAGLQLPIMQPETLLIFHLQQS